MKVFILTRKRMAVLAAAVAVVACTCAAGVKRSDETVAVNAGGRSIPIYCVQTEKKQVSLSFDAAWGDEYTQPLLDILSKYNVKSTFFLVGDWVRKYPDDVKKIADAGHDVGNHSNTHPYMTKLDGDSIKSEIDLCSADVEKITGTRPTLFRPPYGDYNNSVVDTVNSMGMYCVQWSIDSLDWQDPSPDEILQRVKDNLACGAIILMHNGAKNTPEALPKVIEYIQSQGYEIVPISQLIPSGKYTTDPSGMMIPDADKAVKTSAEAASRSTDTSSRSDVTYESSSRAVVSTKPSSLASSKLSSQTSSTRSTVSSEASSYSGLAGELYEKTESRKK